MQTPYTPTDPRPAILLVDDDPFILSAIRQYLGRLTKAYDIIALDNAAEALAHVFWQPVPLLITDFAMLGMNGMQLTQQIKELSPSTRIILISPKRTQALVWRRGDAGDCSLPSRYATIRPPKTGSAYECGAGSRIWIVVTLGVSV
jgi:CheY-like chemotaxis protein